jgi:glycosyltransferase involved in cell wall biosynthesis
MILSIVVVTINNDDALIRTLKSIANCSKDQSLLEVLIVDAGGGDAYKKAGDFIRPGSLVVIKEPDHGIFDGMNKGFKRAKGSWITYLNSGDVYYEHLDLDRLVSNLSRQNALWAVGRAQIYFGGTLRNWDPRNIKPLRFRLGINSFPHQSTFYNRECLSSLVEQPFDVFDSVADWTLSYRLLKTDAPFFFDCLISLNEEAGNSAQIPFLRWSRDVTQTRSKLGELLTKNYLTDFSLQLLVGVISRTRNRVRLLL